MTSQSTLNTPLIVYGHDYCLQAQILVAALTKHQIEYEWRDINLGDQHYQAELRQVACGNLSVPTVVFSDGVVMVEPWPRTVLKKLNLVHPNWFERMLQKWQQKTDPA